MRDKNDCVIKSGIVESIDNKYAKVRIHNESACSMCHSKGVCTALGTVERLIDVELGDDVNIQPGDRVNITMVTHSGNMAVLLAYILPFILLILTLLISSYFFSEGIAALISLLVLLPYFFILYTLKKRIKRYFRFTLH